MKSSVFASLLLLFCMLTLSSLSQGTEKTSGRSQSVYLEFGGSGLGFSGNYDFRFAKNSQYGLGMRVGIGGLRMIFFEDITITSVPVELNYIVSKENRFLPEFGLALIYTHIKQKDFIFSTGYESTDDVLIGYIPFGVRYIPQERGFTARLNAGPMMNLSAPNAFSDNTVVLMIGLSLGYAFN